MRGRDLSHYDAIPHRLMTGWIRCPVCQRQLALRQDGMVPRHVPQGMKHTTVRCSAGGKQPGGEGPAS